MAWLYLLALYVLIGLLIELGIDRSVTIARQFGIEHSLFGPDPRALRLITLIAWPVSAVWAAYLVLRRLTEPSSGE
ncbi:MAG: hypothetical protein AAF495_19300 [Pseudomonadota bacterium]